MADFNSSLPIRSESDGTDAKVVIKIVDGVNGGSNQASVDSDKNLHVESHGNDPAGVDRAQLLTEEGRTTSRGDYNVTTNTKPSSSGLIIHARVAAPTEADQTFRPTGVASSDGSNAKAQDVAIRDEAGNAFTSSNPLPVTFVDSEGTEINDYNTASTVAANATSNHDYTVTAATTLKLAQINASATGKAKFEIQVETGVATNTFATRFVLFNSAANPNVSVDLKELITVAAGVRVRIIRTNKENQAQDLYSTISGHEI